MDRTAGFKTARFGCIHLLCPRCGRKQSNAKRQPHDPARAFVAVLYCPNCAVGGFVEGPDDYLFKNGKSVPQLEDGCGWVHESECSLSRKHTPAERQKGGE